MTKIIDIDCEIIRETDKAILIEDGSIEHAKAKDGRNIQRPKQYWLPRSQIEIDKDAGTVAMPEWLALEKGLI